MRADKELRVQQGGKDGVAGLSIETEQALSLPRREAETWHLEVLGANSAQQFRRWHVHTRTRSHNGFSLSKGSPARLDWEKPFPYKLNMRGAKGGGFDRPVSSLP